MKTKLRLFSPFAEISIAALVLIAISPRGQDPAHATPDTVHNETGVSSCNRAPVKATASSFLSERATQTPDLMQANPAAKLPWSGQAHCGPVAASNTLVWFARNGFENLVKGDPECEQTQFELAQTLGLYMRTSLTAGTTVTTFLRGLEDYLQDKGFQAKLQYAGWEEHPRQFRSTKFPTLSLVRQGLGKNCAAWIKIGWYKYNSRSNTYTRFAGHWVTVVDGGRKQCGAPDNNVIVIHDPAPRSGNSFTSEYCTITPITSGSLETGYGPAVKAAGMLRIAGQLKIKDKADCGLIDGVVVLSSLASL